MSSSLLSENSDVSLPSALATAYRTVHVFDGGATAIVLVIQKKDPTEAGPERLAVKKIRGELDPTAYEQSNELFRNECIEMGRLANQIAAMEVYEQADIAHVPQIYEFDKEYYTWFAMDYAQGKPLSELVAGTERNVSFDEALKILNQYLRLLRLFHQGSHKCYIDNKLDHLFWDDDGKRLTVIDWNTLGPLTPENERNEILMAGFFLYAMAVDPIVPAGTNELHNILLRQQQAVARADGYQYLFTRPDSEELPAWQRLPLGIQLMLYRALDWKERPRKLEPYHRIEELLVDAERLENWMRDQAQFHKEKPAADDPSLAAIEARLIWRDIYLRAFHTQEQPEDAELHWHHQREDWRVWERMVTMPSLEMARNDLRYGNYDTALATIQALVEKNPTLWQPAILEVYLKELYDVSEQKVNKPPFDRVTESIFNFTQESIEFSQEEAKLLRAIFTNTLKVLGLREHVSTLREDCQNLVGYEMRAKLEEQIREVKRQLSVWESQNQPLPFLSGEIMSLECFINYTAIFDAELYSLNEKLELLDFVSRDDFEQQIKQIAKQVASLYRTLRGTPLVISIHTRREKLDRIDRVVKAMITLCQLEIVDPTSLPDITNLMPWQRELVFRLWLDATPDRPEQLIGLTRRVVRYWNDLAENQRVLSDKLRQLSISQLQAPPESFLNELNELLRQTDRRSDLAKLLEAIALNLKAIRMGAIWRETYQALPEQLELLGILLSNNRCSESDEAELRMFFAQLYQAIPPNTLPAPLSGSISREPVANARPGQVGPVPATQSPSIPPIGPRSIKVLIALDDYINNTSNTAISQDTSKRNLLNAIRELLEKSTETRELRTLLRFLTRH